MTIAIFSDNFYPEIGGLQDSVVTMARELSQRGHTIHFFAPTFSHRDLSQGNLPAGELHIGPNVYIHRWRSVHVASPTNQSRFVLPTGLRWLEIKKVKPDVIHTHTFYSVGLEALLVAKMLKLPLVGTNHMAISGFTNYTPIKKATFIKYFLKYAVWYYNHCAYVSAPSSWAIKELVAHGLRRPGGVISNPINVEVFGTIPGLNKAALKNRLNISAAALVFAGRLGPEKNIDVLIRATAEVKKSIPRINLVLAGHGAAEQKLKKLARDLGISEAVKFPGTLSPALLAELYTASDLFAIASTSESQSMVTLQAMACGLPVVAANSRALPDYVNDSNGRLAEPGNPQDFARQITALLSQPQQLRQLGENAHIFAQKFAAPTIADQWEAIYKQVTSK